MQLLLPVLFILAGLQGMGPNSGPGPKWPGKEPAMPRGLVGSLLPLVRGLLPRYVLERIPRALAARRAGAEGALEREDLRGKAV